MCKRWSGFFNDSKQKVRDVVSFKWNGHLFSPFLVRGKERDEIQMPIPPDEYGAYFGIQVQQSMSFMKGCPRHSILKAGD